MESTPKMTGLDASFLKLDIVPGDLLLFAGHVYLVLDMPAFTEKFVAWQTYDITARVKAPWRMYYNALYRFTRVRDSVTVNEVFGNWSGT